MKLLTVVILVLLSLPIQAQVDRGAVYNLYARQIDVNSTNEFFGLSEDEFKNLEGSPYENKEFLAGNIYENDKMLLKDVYLRYNAYADEIEIKQNENGVEYNALIKTPDMFVKIFRDVYIFVPLNGSIEQGGYFQIVTPGDHYDLYKKTFVEFKDAYFGTSTYDRDRPAKFIKTTNYFLVSKDGKFVEVPTKQRKLLDVMKSKKVDIKSFLKSSNIDLTKEADLTKLVNYYNTIL